MASPELRRYRVWPLPQGTTVEEIKKSLAQHGRLHSVVIESGIHGLQALVAVRSFSVDKFWTNSRAVLSLKKGFKQMVRLQIVSSPHHLNNITSTTSKYPEFLELIAERLDFGIMRQESQMIIHRTVTASGADEITLRLETRFRTISVDFPIFYYQRPSNPKLRATLVNDLMRFKISLQSINDIKESLVGDDGIVLSFTLPIPPRYFRRLDNVDEGEGGSWYENDMWYRQTDLTDEPYKLKKAPITIRKADPIIDFGYSTSFRLSIRRTTQHEHLYQQLRSALLGHNINITKSSPLDVSDPQPAVEGCPFQRIESGEDLVPNEHVLDAAPALPFEVRYQLDVCLSSRVIDENDLSPAFMDKLSNLPAKHARGCLERLAVQGRRIYDPHAALTACSPVSLSSLAVLPRHCILSRSVTVTPTCLHVNTPSLETSNRILRWYPKHADRFIRGKIYPDHKPMSNEIYTRVKRTLRNGIYIAGRQYDWLSSGNSQFREHGAYFFSSCTELSIQDIRRWMGSFDEIRNVALLNARLGQCFSTTRAISTQPDIVEIEDIEHNGYIFSDGVGKLSPAMAQASANSVGMFMTDVPSVFQFRMGGCKGVLAKWPDVKDNEVHIRLSQYKFAAAHEGLEIIRWSQFTAAHLNRQIIVVLSGLGVPNHVFLQKMRVQLDEIDQAMDDDLKAIELLRHDVDRNQMTLRLADMIRTGFMTRKEPFMLILLQLWRSWTIKYLKEKARIFIPNGALLLGCLDETGTLKGHWDREQKELASVSSIDRVGLIPEVFVQLSRSTQSDARIVTGPMLLTRNPSLHPGDIRVVRGVDVPALRHLTDCVVFPNNGDRDVPSMCAGGDLDGDDFIVIWDPELIPQIWNHKPMEHTAISKQQHPTTIADDDLTTFFVTYMKNDSLSRIAHAHLANADKYSIMSEKCLRLAELHSLAVDYVKTGSPAQMTNDLRPVGWPHFMTNKQIEKQYRSTSVLGRLYDEVEKVKFDPGCSAPFDNSMLGELALTADILRKARVIKDEYDSHMRRIMTQYSIATEFEVWSGFVLYHNSSNDYSFHEKIGAASTALKDHFRRVCTNSVGGPEHDRLTPLVSAMYKITNEEVLEHSQKEDAKRQDSGVGNDVQSVLGTLEAPLISFPWLFAEVLGRLANASQVRMLHSTISGTVAESDKPKHSSTEISEDCSKIEEQARSIESPSPQRLPAPWTCTQEDQGEAAIPSIELSGEGHEELQSSFCNDSGSGECQGNSDAFHTLWSKAKSMQTKALLPEEQEPSLMRQVDIKSKTIGLPRVTLPDEAGNRKQDDLKSTGEAQSISSNLPQNRVGGLTSAIISADQVAGEGGGEGEGEGEKATRRTIFDEFARLGF